MSKIQELIHDDSTILVFDVDGVLAKMEYGEYNHYALDDEAWTNAILNGESFYHEDDVIDSMKKFIESKNLDNIYVCTKAFSEEEGKMKSDFINKYYNIKNDHIFYVNDNKEKLEIMHKIKELNPSIPDNHIAMIDDTVEVLNYIMDNSNYATIHISSFM